jgi:phosphoserine phosphatase
VAKKDILAICYDFDGTLSPGNMQENSFIPELSISAAEFWKETKELAEKNDMDEILAYMYLMLKKAQARDQKIDKNSFISHGKSIHFFPGVEEWFDRITNFGLKNDITVLHYIISSGLREMIEGCSIAKKFKLIFASGFLYDQHSVAVWPALSINYTNKTQYLFRINKGIENSWDNTTINKFTPEEKRPVPFSNMIYIGDGETDIPAMKMVKYQGGTAIAVYPPQKGKKITKSETKKKESAKTLLKDSRADFISSADYSEGSEIDKIIKNLIMIIAMKNENRKIGTIK